MKKRLKNGILARIFVLMLAVILILSSSGLRFFVVDEISELYGAFIGKKSEYNGVIELWNIDSFEAGTGSKYSYLERCASGFQKQNKGVYVVIRNLSESECLNLINAGVFPDLISCSYGVSDKFKNLFSAYSKNELEINQKLIKAGSDQSGELLGLAWCLGYYFLISTKTKLEHVKNLTDEFKLNEIAFECGYEYKIGKKLKKSVSLCFGTGDYLMPKNALLAYNKARSIQIESVAQSERVSKSQYSAYTSFLANDATILLGTQRDVWRISSREEKGKVSDIYYLPLTNWTDLVQYVFVLKTSEGDRRVCAENFAFSLVSKNNQKGIEDIGMIPVNLINETSYRGVMRDIVLDNFSDLELNPLFE